VPAERRQFVFRESSREYSGACRQVLVDLRGLGLELDGGARLELIRGCDTSEATFAVSMPRAKACESLGAAQGQPGDCPCR
jgi:hypothetical protein